jgi:hypothetical protein
MNEDKLFWLIVTLATACGLGAILALHAMLG